MPGITVEEKLGVEGVKGSSINRIRRGENVLYLALSKLSLTLLTIASLFGIESDAFSSWLQRVKVNKKKTNFRKELRGTSYFV